MVGMSPEAASQCHVGKIRHLEEADYQPIIRVLDSWWGGRHIAHLLPRIFFIHFPNTSFAIEHNGDVIGFLCGFISQADPSQAYIHFVGVHPDHRCRMIGTRLYTTFFEAVVSMGCTTIRCITSPVNKLSVSFHRRMGFQIEGENGEAEGMRCTFDYELNGEDRVLFIKYLGVVSTE